MGTQGCAVVTGSGQGIGRAIALRLAREGRDVAIVDVDPAAAERTAGEVKALGRRAHVAVANVAARQSVLTAVRSIEAALGPIDVLVNNAGILRTARFIDISERDWQDTLDVNLGGLFHCSQAVLPAMLARRSGCIVNMSSWTGKKGVPHHAAYSASKAATIAVTQSLAAELAGDGIRVNAVCPGIIVDTRMRDDAEALSRSQGLPDVDTRVQGQVPMRRPGLPGDVAGVVAFLVSADASYMTGQAINVTGGLWMN